MLIISSFIPAVHKQVEPRRKLCYIFCWNERSGMPKESFSNRIRTFFQHSAVKVISAVVLFAVFVFLITFVVFKPYERIFSNKNEFELTVLGSSLANWGTDSRVLTEETGLKTSVLAAESCDYDGRLEMLRSAITQKSLKEVIVEISCGSLWTGATPAYKELYFNKISGWTNKLRAAFRQLSLWKDEYDTVFAQLLNNGIQAWEAIFDGTYEDQFERHGFEPKDDKRFTDTPETVASMDLGPIYQDYDYTRLARLRDMILLCQENGVDIVLVTYPATTASTWVFSQWDTFHTLMTEFSRTMGVPYYDFNLMVDKYDYLPDYECYLDIEHLTPNGAATFSKILGDIVNARRNGTELPYSFYNTFEEAREYNYYRQFVS